MIEFRFRWKKLGGHVHIRVFAGRSDMPDTPGVKLGDLVFGEDQWAAFGGTHQGPGPKIRIVEDA